MGWHDADVVRATGIRYARAGRFEAPSAQPPAAEPIQATTWAPACPQAREPITDEAWGVTISDHSVVGALGASEFSAQYLSSRRRRGARRRATQIRSHSGSGAIYLAVRVAPMMGAADVDFFDRST